MRTREVFSFHGTAVNSRQISIILPNDPNGVIGYRGNSEFWNVRGNSIRGGWRDATSNVIMRSLRKVDPNTKVSTDTARLLTKGGVKSSGSSRQMTPGQIEQAKAMNPQIEMFGGSEPAFFGGHTYVSHMMSEQPIDRSNGRRYHLQVVRTPLARSSFTLDDLSDPEKIAEQSEANRYRSQVFTLHKQVAGLEAKLAKKPADKKLTAQLAQAMTDLKTVTDKDFKDANEVREFLDALLVTMQKRGQSTVSEQTIPVGQEVIPIGTLMNHSFHFHGASPIGCGMLIDGISHKSFLNPVVGGRAAAGCGGWIKSRYDVKRVEGNKFVDDCTIELIPEHHIIFHGAEHSRLKACHEEWLQCDIRQFDFTFEGLQRIAGNGSVADETC